MLSIIVLHFAGVLTFFPPSIIFFPSFSHFQFQIYVLLSSRDTFLFILTWEIIPSFFVFSWEVGA